MDNAQQMLRTTSNAGLSPSYCRSPRENLVWNRDYLNNITTLLPEVWSTQLYLFASHKILLTPRYSLCSPLQDPLIVTTHLQVPAILTSPQSAQLLRLTPNTTWRIQEPTEPVASPADILAANSPANDYIAGLINPLPQSAEQTDPAMRLAAASPFICRPFLPSEGAPPVDLAAGIAGQAVAAHVVRGILCEHRR